MKKQKPLKHAVKKRQPAQQSSAAQQHLAEQQQHQQQNYRIISMSIVALLASIVAYVLTAKFALLFYHPNVEQALEVAKRTFLVGGRPEPVEAFLYRFGMLTVPLFMVGFFLLLTKTRLSAVRWERYFKPLSIGFVLLAIAMLYAGLQSFNPSYVEQPVGNNYENSRDLLSATNFQFYFSESVLSANPLKYFGLGVPLVFGLVLIFKRFHKFLVAPKLMQGAGLLLILGYAAFYLVEVYQIFSFDFPYTWENKWNFNQIFYPIPQVFAGNPMLVDDFVFIYGLYAHFLNPLFQISGLSVETTTTVLALLIVLIFALSLVAMLRMMKSKLYVGLGFSSFLFLCLLLSRTTTPFDAYFSMFPIRQLLPAITICMASFYLKNRSKILYFAELVLLGFGFLWNPEFGVVCLIAWIAMLCYTEFSSSRWKTVAVACVKHIVRSVITVSLCIAVFSVSIYLQYGAFPHLPALFTYMSYFGGASIGWLIPMTLWHPWNFVILVYLIGLIYAIQALFNKSSFNAKSAFILLLSIMGFGFFSYFQGRSHNWNLIVVSGNAIILLAVFADLLLGKTTVKQWPVSFAMASIAIISVLGFSCVDLYRHRDKWESLEEQTAEKKANLEEQKQVESNMAFIKEISPRAAEKVYVHASNKHQTLYFTAANKRSAFHSSIADMFTYANCTRLKNQMLVDTFDVLIEPLRFYYNYLQDVNAAMCATYSVDTTNGQIVLLKKRRYHTPEQPVLDENQNPQVLVYEKFGDDTTSLNRRIRCATKGKEPLSWDNQLSMEVIFFAGQQAYSAGTLFSNYDDSTGVWLLNNGAPEKYLFQWGKNWGIILDVTPNKWCYLVVQVDKNLISVFVNGDLRYRYLLPAPITSTARRFYIASDGQKNLHFTGAISEILVKKGLSSPQEILARQKKIQEQ